MKQKYVILVILLIFVLATTGCVNKNQDQKGEQAQRGEFRRPDFGQPEEPADLRGLVKDVLGNEVTVLKMERQNREGDVRDPEGQDQNSQSDNQNSQQNERRFNGRMPMGGGMAGGPGMGGGRPEMDEESRAEMMNRLKEMSTGEEKVIIPVGIKMMKTSFSNGKMEAVEASLEDVTADKMIQIWLNKEVEDKQVASFVLINS